MVPLQVLPRLEFLAPNGPAPSCYAPIGPVSNGPTHSGHIPSDPALKSLTPSCPNPNGPSPSGPYPNDPVLMVPLTSGPTPNALDSHGTALNGYSHSYFSKSDRTQMCLKSLISCKLKFAGLSILKV